MSDHDLTETLIHILTVNTYATIAGSIFAGSALVLAIIAVMN